MGEAAATAAIVAAAGLLTVAAIRWLARQAIRELHDTIDARLAPIAAELRPNGGRSIKDQVGHIERLVTALAASVEEHTSEAEAAEAEVWAALARLGYERRRS